jgi:hypothetical protein
MPKPKIELIRLQQEAVVNNLLTIARYTNTKPVYTAMTQEEFNKTTCKTMRNLDHISTICTRSIRACRHGQNLAPKVGPLSHYYRLFEDFGEILHLESDKILTLQAGVSPRSWISTCPDTSQTTESHRSTKHPTTLFRRIWGWGISQHSPVFTTKRHFIWPWYIGWLRKRLW